MTATLETEQRAPVQRNYFYRHRLLWLGLALGIIAPFVIAAIDGQSPAAVLNSESGNSKFLQGLAIEVFILAIYAISYDIILGITGLLSFGHAMFFAVGAYTTGIMLKSFDWGLPATLIALIIAALLQAVLFAVVLPRVSGIAYALVTLGFASVFFIVIQSSEVGDYTGADVGLQGIPVPDWLDTNFQRYRFYLVAMFSMAIIYLIYHRIVASPTGSVMIANRENENRALALGYNTFWFKFFALLVSSLTAAYAGMLFALHQPIVTPQVAGLGWTVAALLMILIGGVGTLTGAFIGAAVFRLMQYYLDRWFGGSANLLLGAAYILIVLFLPFGIVGTWRARSNDIRRGRDYLARLFTGRGT